MTIYGTPSGTPLNTTPFQGTQPGNPVQAMLQIATPGVGLFPPGANNASGDSTLAAASRGAQVLNAIPANFQLGAPCPTLLAVVSGGGTSGACQSGALIGLNTMNISANGGSGPGPICQNNSPAVAAPSGGGGSGAESQLPLNFSGGTFNGAFGG